MCDAVVQLPCRGVKNSMNVAVSAGMCGYEIARQWTAVDEPNELQQQEASGSLGATADAECSLTSTPAPSV